MPIKAELIIKLFLSVYIVRKVAVDAFKTLTQCWTTQREYTFSELKITMFMLLSHQY